MKQFPLPRNASRLPSSSREWNRGGFNSGGEDEFPSLLAGGPEDYVDYAADYFEVDLPLAVVEGIFDLAPITPEMDRLLRNEMPR